MTNEERNIKAVIFDMTGVIIPTPLVQLQDFEISENLEPGIVARTIQENGDQGVWVELEKGRCTSKEFVKLFSKELSDKVGRHVDASGLLERFRRYGEPFPELIDAIKSVKAAGMKTALLTNNWRWTKDESWLPVNRELFDVIIESCVVKLRKPHPKIYEICINELNVNPHEAVFLDDTDINLEPAKLLGMYTIKVTSPRQAVKDLEEMLGGILDDQNKPQC